MGTSDNILSYIAVYNRDTYVQVSLTSESNVGMSFDKVIINKHSAFGNCNNKIILQWLQKIKKSPLGINVAKNDSANSVNAAKNDD